MHRTYAGRARALRTERAGLVADQSRLLSRMIHRITGMTMASPEITTTAHCHTTASAAMPWMVPRLNAGRIVEGCG